MGRMVNFMSGISIIPRCQWRLMTYYLFRYGLCPAKEPLVLVVVKNERTAKGTPGKSV
jgi:hypothetical protein